MSDGKRHFFGNKKIFFLKGRQLRAVEIILLWVVTTARTCTGMFCGNCQHAGVAETASLLAYMRYPPVQLLFVFCGCLLPIDCFLQTYT